MNLEQGKYIIQNGNSFSGHIEYWMVYQHKGNIIICKDHGLPTIAKEEDLKIFMDDGIRILKKLELHQSIQFRKTKIIIEAQDQFGNQASFTARNYPVLQRILSKFPTLTESLQIEGGVTLQFSTKS